MKGLEEFINQFPEYIGIFILMLSTFLIGYFSAWWLQRSRYHSIVKRLKKKNDILKKASNVQLMQDNIKNIDTIFTEIKPKIIKVVKETQEGIIEAKTPKRVALKARTSYATYTKSKPKLNFDNFGRADSNNSNDLTKLNGIGPYIEQKLNEIGIYNYDQISRFNQVDINVITELIDFFPGRIERDNWIGQANSLKDSSKV